MEYLGIIVILKAEQKIVFNLGIAWNSHRLESHAMLIPVGRYSYLGMQTQWSQLCVAPEKNHWPYMFGFQIITYTSIAWFHHYGLQEETLSPRYFKTNGPIGSSLRWRWPCFMSVLCVVETFRHTTWVTSSMYSRLAVSTASFLSWHAEFPPRVQDWPLPTFCSKLFEKYWIYNWVCTQ